MNSFDNIYLYFRDPINRSFDVVFPELTFYILLYFQVDPYQDKCDGSKSLIFLFSGLATTLVFEAPVVHLEKLLFGYLGVARLPAVNKYKVE